VKTVLVILGVHAVASIALWLMTALDSQTVGYYAAIFFFLLNTPGVWILKGLGASPALAAMGFAYGGPLTLATTQVALAAVIFFCMWGWQKVAPNNTIERDADVTPEYRHRLKLE